MNLRFPNKKIDMLKKSLRVRTILGVFLIAALFSSCNRGYGCPTDFSIGFDWLAFVESLLAPLG